MSDDRDMGIDFHGLGEELENEEYPLTKEELLSKYGEWELDHAGGTDTVEELLAPLGHEEFDGQDAVHQAILNMVGSEAEGRPRYSDRGGATPNEQQEAQGVDEGVGEEDEQKSL